MIGQRWRRAWRDAVLPLLLAGPLAAWAAASAPAQTPAAMPASAPALFFRAPALAAPLSLGPQVLTAQEQAYVAALPEVRVAVPMPPAKPYEQVAANGEVSGIHPQMLGYLARALGLRLRAVPMADWSSALQAVRRHEVDLVMTIGLTAERSEYLAFTLGATPMPGALFARVAATPARTAASPSAASIPPARGVTDAQLARARFVLEKDFAAVEFVRRQYPHASLLTVPNTGDALAALASGRADYYLGSLLETLDWLSRKPVPGIEINRLLNYGSGYYHFALRKDWAPLAGILNKGISTLRASAGGKDSWLQAAASIPGGVQLQQPLALSDGELQTLLQTPVWRLGAVRGLPLLNNVEPNGSHSGIAAEYSEEVARRLGVGLQVVPFDNVAEMLDGLRRGQIDLVPFLTRTPERERSFVFSRPYVEMPYLIVARSDAPLYWDLASLRGRRLALARAHPLLPLMAQRYPEIEVVEVADGNEALDRVADGRVDAAIEVKLFANLRINSDNNGRLRAVAAVPDLSARFQFAALPANAALLRLVDRALLDIPATENQRLLRRWVAIDLDPAFPWRRYLPLIGVVVLALLMLAAGSAWWLRRLSREVRARRRSEQRLNDIAATLPCVAFRYLVDKDHALKATWASPGAQRLLGLEPERGRPILDSVAERLRPDQRQQAFERQRHSMRTGERFQATGAYRHPDGSERWLTCEAVRTPAEGEIFAWTGYIVDVSHEHELQAHLAAAAEARKLLLASASHELRAPTHTLSLALQSLAPERLQGDDARALRIARDAVGTLTQLLNDVLDAARFDSAQMRLQASDFSLRGWLQPVREAAEVQAATKGLDFACRIDDDVPDRVYLDPLRLQQVLTNLLSNAFKYTRSGRVDLLVTMGADAEGRPCALCLTVSDTGIGIEPARQAALFQPFTTAHDGSVTAVPEGSSGLGLVICRQLAGLMHGRIELHSEPGRGTRVALRLPWPASAGLAEPVGPVGRTDTLLLCDDDDTSRMLMAHGLRAAGYAVHEAHDGAAALARWRQGGILALVTDLEMPGQDGLALVRQIRSDEGKDGPRLPIIVCSGHAAADAPTSGAGADPDAWLQKPADLQQLQAVLNRLTQHALV